jgi:hypothetical protein
MISTAVIRLKYFMVSPFFYRLFGLYLYNEWGRDLIALEREKRKEGAQH